MIRGHVKKWKLFNEKGEFFEALRTDLSKASDLSLKIISSYLKERTQRTSFNSGKDLLSSKRVYFGTSLFNIFLCHLFILIKDIEIVSYAYDNTSYIAGENIDQVISVLQNAASLFNWFSNESESWDCNLLINESCKEGISGNITVNAKNYQEQRLVLKLALNWMWYIYAWKLVIRFMC